MKTPMDSAETIPQTELHDLATQYAVRYGGCKTTTQVELLRRAAGRLSGHGDKAEAVRRIKEAVDFLFRGTKSL